MRVFVLPSMLLLASSVHGQVSFPFPDSAATWVQYFEIMVTPPPLTQFEVQSFSNICISGQDTSIAGLQYKMVEQCDLGYVGALRDDSGQVFFLAADSIQEHVLYDFTVVAGDTVHEIFVDGGLAYGGGSYPLLVDMVVDTMEIESDGRKQFSLYPVQNEFLPSQIWMEGFGSPYGLFSEQDPINVSGYWAGIHCMSHLDTIWYYSPGSVSSFPGTCAPQYVGYTEIQREETHAFPNPTDGIFSVDIGTDQVTSVTITDLQGVIFKPAMELRNRLLRVDLVDLADGTYLLQLRTLDRSHVHKIIKNAGQ